MFNKSDISRNLCQLFGKKLHNKLWNGGNGYGRVQLFHSGKLVDDVTCYNVGCEYGEYDKEVK